MLQLVKTKDYLLLIDEEAEINNYIIAKDLSGIAKIKEYKRAHILAIEVLQDVELGISYYQKSNWIKIIAYRKLNEKAKELDLPLLPNPFKDKVDVERLAEEYLQKWRGLNNVHLSNIIHADRCKNDFIAGYKTAQSKQFSLEDMIGFAKYYILKHAIPYELDVISGKITDEQKVQMLQNDIDYDWNELAQKYIQSLSTQQLPKEFIPEYYTNGDMIVKNRNGVRELIGTYKY